MNNSEIKKEAKTLLVGKWNKLAIITILYLLTIFLSSFIISLLTQWLHIPILGLSIYVLIVPFGFGYMVSVIKILRGASHSYLSFFKEGFSSFSKVWSVVGNTLLKFIVPIILIIIFMIFSISGISFAFINSILSTQLSKISLVVSIIGSLGLIITIFYCIPKSFLYFLSYFILHDNPEMNGKEVVEESAKLMHHYRWKLFYLYLSFIGWTLLASFGFMIIYTILLLITFSPLITYIISLIIFYIALSYIMVYLITSFYIFYENRKVATSEEPEIITESKREEP